MRKQGEWVAIYISELKALGGDIATMEISSTIWFEIGLYTV